MVPQDHRRYRGGDSAVTLATEYRDRVAQPIDLLARPERFELPTSWFVARHSIQLSYGRAALGSASGTGADTETQFRRGIPWRPLSETGNCAVARNRGHFGGAHPTTSSNFLIFLTGAGRNRGNSGSAAAARPGFAASSRDGPCNNRLGPGERLVSCSAHEIRS